MIVAEDSSVGIGEHRGERQTRDEMKPPTPGTEIDSLAGGCGFSCCARALHPWLGGNRVLSSFVRSFAGGRTVKPFLVGRNERRKGNVSTVGSFRFPAFRKIKLLPRRAFGGYLHSVQMECGNPGRSPYLVQICCTVQRWLGHVLIVDGLGFPPKSSGK